MKRRDFLKAAAASTALAGANAMMGGKTASALATKSELDELYNKSIVIDTLSFAHRWDEEENKAIDASGYTGIITSLSRRNLKTALDQLVEWHQRIREQPQRFMMALTAEDFITAKKTGKLAVMMNFQNATMLEGDLDNVDVLYGLGTRCFQLTYNSRNKLGDGSTERTNAGLSDFGIAVVERMNDLGILVDVSHSGRQTSLDAIEFSKKPIAFTHTMCEALRPNHPRAKTDQQFRNLADKGGVAGMAALGYFIGKNPGTDTTIEHYVDHIEHAVNVMGIDHVGVCTDYPIRGLASWATRENWYEPRLKSFKPSYDVQWPAWLPEMDPPQRFRNLLTVLDRRGWKTGDMEKILGQNWLRLFKDVFGA